VTISTEFLPDTLAKHTLRYWLSLHGALPQTPRFSKAYGGQQIKRELESSLEAIFIRRPHPGYPLASCSSAELTSVSPEPL